MRLDTDSAITKTVCEIDGLEAFVQQRMEEDDSFLRNQIQKLVLEYHHSKSLQARTMQISVLLNSSGAIFATTVALDMTLFALKMRLEFLNPNSLPISTLTIDRTRQSFSSLDNRRTLSDCGIREGDRLVAEYSCIAHKGVRRIEASGLVAASGFQYIALALHAFMLDEGFQAIVEIKNAKEGFRPLCKELHSGVFLRPNWNCNPGSINITYKHTSQRSNVFLLSCEDLMGSFFLSMSVRARAINEYTEFDVCAFVEEITNAAGVSHYSLRSEEQLRGKLKNLLLRVIPGFYAQGKLSKDSPLSIKEIRANLRKQQPTYLGMRATTSIVPHDPPMPLKTHHKSLRVQSHDSLPPQDNTQEDPYDPYWWMTNYAQLAVRDSSPMRPPPRVPYRPPAGLPPAPREDFQAYLEHPEVGRDVPPAMPAPLAPLSQYQGSLLHPDHRDSTHPGFYYPFVPSVQGGCWQGPNPYFRNKFLEAYNCAGRRGY